LLGEPTEKSSTEYRFGTRGSVAVDLKKGTYFDHEANVGGGVIDLVMSKQRLDKDEALAWLRDRKHIEPSTGRRAFNVVKSYDYIDVNGVLLFQVCRLDPKDFRQRRPDPDKPGKWLWKMAGIQRVIYRLPEVVAAIADGHMIFVVEGEKAADALRRLGVTATCSPGGANKWRQEYAAAFTGADVVILPDNDEPGRQHAEMVASSLRSIKDPPRVRVLNLPDLPKKGDVADWLAAGGNAAELQRLVEATPTATAPVAKAGRRKATLTPESGIDLPVIRVVAGELHLTASAAESALLRSDLPIFQRGSSLVRPVVQDVPAARGRMTVSAALHEVDGVGIVDALCGVARWERFDARAEDWVRINPPRAVADVMLSRVGMWSFPKIVGVITTPTIRPDGSILSAPGYDPATRLYHVADPAVVLSSAVREPTREMALKALELLKGLLKEFPFTSEVSRAVALSALITPVARGALTVAPMHLFRANTAGSGKSYLVDVASAINSGRPCPVVSAGNTDEETEKRLAGLLLAGFPLVSLDNVNGELGGDLLCQAIERPFIRLRPLGRSDIVEIESRATIFGTGNGLRVRGDMVRRSLTGDLDAGMERPELREFQGDPVATVLENRGRYVSACLAIVRAYIVAGRPHLKAPIASFADWSDLVRSAIVWLGCADPADSMERAREDDPELSELREIAGLWKETLGLGNGFTVKDLADRADERTKTLLGEPTEHAHPEWRDCLIRIAGERGTVSTKRLGYWLRNREGRIVNGLRVAKAGTAHGGAALWSLKRASS
jgi:putative DNA primase/helicase